MLHIYPVKKKKQQIKNLKRRILRPSCSDPEARTCTWTLLQQCRVWLLPGHVLTASRALLFLTPRLFFLCRQEVSFDAWASPVSMGRVSLVCGILLLLSTPLLATGTTTEPCPCLVYVTLCRLPLMIYCGMFPSFTAALGWRFPIWCLESQTICRTIILCEIQLRNTVFHKNPNSCNLSVECIFDSGVSMEAHALISHWR